MGSSYFGFPSMRNNERSSSSSSSSSSRKSKKNGSDKPKQPQRGLGVAQLEQIRLRSQMGCGSFPPSLIHGGSHLSPGSHLIQEDMTLQGVPYGGPQSLPSTSSPYAHHPNFMMLYGDERANPRYQDSQPSTAPRWNPNYGIGVQDSSPYTQPGAMDSRHLYNHFEDSSHKRFDILKPMGSSSSQNSDTSDQELDLELRLSI